MRGCDSNRFASLIHDARQLEDRSGTRAGPVDSWRGSGFNISEYTDEKIAAVAPMQSARVMRVVAVMRLDFHNRRKA
jgi:hypothetical protein